MNLNNTSSKTLWIGEIDSWMDEKFLLNVFSKYANVRNIKIIRDKITGLHQGYGFVEFESPEVAAYVLENCIGNLIPNSNKAFKLNWATFSEGKMNAVMGNFSNNNNIVEHTIYVCDLDLNVSEQMLREVFTKLYPSVSASKLIIDPISKQSKGYGFVKFSDFNESQKAILEMNGKYILNKAIKTNQAVWKKYSPETKVNSNSKPFYPKNNNNKYKQGNTYNNTNTRYTPSNVNEERVSIFEEKVEPPQVVTQNINIYLQSLYQQHYLNNVYLNHYIGGNSYNFPEGSESNGENMFQDENNDNVYNNNDNDDGQNQNQNYNENYTKFDSTVNSEGK